MRGFRSTFILLAVLLGLLGYIYYYMKPLSDQPTEQKAKVFTVNPDKIEELRIKASSGETTTLKKVNGTWELVEPVTARADEAEVSGIITNLASLEIQRVIDENPADISQFGLTTPKTEVSFRRTGDKDLSRLELGDQTATGGDIYARRLSEKQVFLVSSFVETTFNRTPFDLREKTLLKFERDKVDLVEIVGKDVAVTLGKTGEQWRLTKPIAARADATVVDGLIGRLQTAHMAAIAAADPTPAQLAGFGLEKPAWTATIGAGSTRASLVVGGTAADGNTYYARDAARAMVFTIEKALVDELQKKAGDYRPKDVFEFRPFSVARIAVTRDGTTATFENTKDKDGKEKWVQTAPARDVDLLKIDALLSALSRLTVTEYVDNNTVTGTEKPAAVVAVTFDDGKKNERVVFGKVANDVFAVRSGEPGAGKVEAAKFDAALAALDALK
jgi:hypothetical protein